MSALLSSLVSSFRKGSLAAKLYEAGGEEAVWSLTEALSGSLGFDQAPAYIKSEWGVQTSSAAVHNWWVDIGKPLFIERIQAAGRRAEETMQAAEEAGITDEDVLTMIRVKALDSMTAPGADPDETFAWVNRALKAIGSQQKQQRLDQLERALKASEDARAKAKESLSEVAKKGGLSDEALKRIEEAAGLL